jgi:hypothetical protein
MKVVQSRSTHHESNRLLDLLEGAHFNLAHAFARDAELVRKLLESALP